MRMHNVTKVTLSGITLMNVRCFTIIPGRVTAVELADY
jgi:hypothetical protein